MSRWYKNPKRLLIIVVILFIATPLLVELGINTGWARKKLEEFIREESGMTVRFGGAIGLDLFPKPAIAIEALQLALAATQFATVERAAFDFSLTALLQERLHSSGATIRGLDLHLTDQSLAAIEAWLATDPDDPLPLENLRVGHLQFSDSRVLYESGSRVDIREIDLTGENLELITGYESSFNDLSDLLVRTHLNGSIGDSVIVVDDFRISDIRGKVVNRSGVISTEAARLDYFGIATTLDITLDIRDAIKKLHLAVSMPDVEIAKLLAVYGAKSSVEGTMNVAAQFTAQAPYISDLLNQISGSCSIRGESLILKGIDLDRALDEFRKMKGFGAHDYASLLMLGPMGGIVSHGYGQLESLRKIMAAEGDSVIREVVSDWSVRAGVATAEDVAFSTDRNRVAAKGRLNLARSRYDGFTVAIVDASGCSINRETLNGPFDSPEIKDSDVISRTVVRPVKRWVDGNKCRLFYEGALPHPEARP